ncbi:YdiK family protein [Paraliobacillus salinarum]|uniref:YdiK family protein n=1 Tax=Paraliobacillus salinarum TaxID=1158996 RepID=UPI0015F58B59|nr:YdiK family protein [Paraliobacillus salinarum]
MRNSPLALAVMYFIIGSSFTFFGIESAEGTLWNFFTVLLATFATFNFAIAIRLVALHIHVKRKNNNP